MKDYAVLSKPRISCLVALTAAFGYWVGGGEAGLPMAALVLGTTLASAGCGSLNQSLEGARDALMERTKDRPVAAGRMTAGHAAAAGLLFSAAGLALLWKACGPLAAGLTLATTAAYLLYTVLKTVTPQTTWIGAAAGAAPPLIGWAAARGSLAPQAWALFGIQFLWQIPHFLALFLLYRDDYERAGFRVMAGGRTTGAQIALNSCTMVAAALLPVSLGMAGRGYGIAALTLSAGYLVLGLKASWSLAACDTRRLFLGSLAYLPLLFASLLIGGV